MNNFEPSFSRYLAAKKSVDDRALNAHVWRTLVSRLATDQPTPLRVLEIGAGIGTMLERLLAQDLLGHAIYHAVDAQPENISAAHARLRAWAVSQGYTITEHAGGNFTLTQHSPPQSVSVQLESCDALALADRDEISAQYNLLIAHAFLDLLDLPTALPRLLRPLRPGGLIYATINFDGATIFEPVIDPQLDAQIEALYHRTMDERMTAGRQSGDSRTGRHLFARLPEAGVEIVAAGSSDWVVHASQPGRYPADQAYFLHFIIDTVNSALQGHPELDVTAFSSWVAARHRQIEAGELVYIAHQLDFLGRKASPPA